MKLSYDDHGSITVLTVSGPLTADHADAFRRGCEERLSSATRDFILDALHVTAIDSEGLECLLWLLDQISARAARLRMLRPDGVLARALHLTRLEGRFDVHDNVESAAKSLRSAGMRESA